MSVIPHVLGPLDWVALAVFFAVWMILGRLIEHPPASRPSTSALMSVHRTRWVKNLPTRENRVADAILLTSLRNGAAFFASGTMIAIGGLFAALGQVERIVDVAADLAGPVERRAEVWEVKLLFLLLLVVNAFLRFVWAHRIFGYVAVLIGAMPDRPEDPDTPAAVRRATALNNSAGRSFNRGLRGIYVSITALAWFIGPVALIAASGALAALLIRREFLSASRQALLE